MRRQRALPFAILPEGLRPSELPPTASRRSTVRRRRSKKTTCACCFVRRWTLLLIFGGNIYICESLWVRQDPTVCTIPVLPPQARRRQQRKALLLTRSKGMGPGKHSSSVFRTLSLASAGVLTPGRLISKFLQRSQKPHRQRRCTSTILFATVQRTKRETPVQSLNQDNLPVCTQMPAARNEASGARTFGRRMREYETNGLTGSRELCSLVGFQRVKPFGASVQNKRRQSAQKRSENHSF